MYDREATGTQDDIRACAAQIRILLPALAERHSPLVLLAALSEHVGGALLVCMQAGTCTTAQAQAILDEIERATFAD